MQRHLEEHVASPLDAKKLAGDEDEVLLGEEGEVFQSEDARERRREVDVGARLLLDRLHDAALPPRDDVVELVVDLADLGMKSTLRSAKTGQLLLPPPSELRWTHQLIQQHQQPHARLLNALVRPRNDDLDVPLRLESKANVARDLPNDCEVRLGEGRDLVELAPHLDLDVLLAVQHFGAGDLDDRLALGRGKEGLAPPVQDRSKRLCISLPSTLLSRLRSHLPFRRGTGAHVATKEGRQM